MVGSDHEVYLDRIIDRGWGIWLYSWSICLLVIYVLVSYLRVCIGWV